ncbi:hypothetical protein CEXT_335781 [Caerostris extrusa]|uniref:Uncharacterized protein n=1 Tax=Caerostris extrusa TaxID=172846 RepID=A0AAV4M4I9_CAEEX|nr:hypothetical protein CEXT_335781 [Caerostris extrusa]
MRLADSNPPNADNNPDPNSRETTEKLLSLLLKSKQTALGMRLTDSNPPNADNNPDPDSGETTEKLLSLLKSESSSYD